MQHLRETFSGAVPYDKKELIDVVAFHMVKDMVPVYSVEKERFIEQK